MRITKEYLRSKDLAFRSIARRREDLESWSVIFDRIITNPLATTDEVSEAEAQKRSCLTRLILLESEG